MTIIHDPRQIEEEIEYATKCKYCKCVFTFVKSEADFVAKKKILFFKFDNFYVKCPSCQMPSHTLGLRFIIRKPYEYGGL